MNTTSTRYRFTRVCHSVHLDSIAGLGVFLFSLVLSIFAMPPDIVWGDAPELAAAAWVLGVPHPTGYPLYLLFTRLFQWLPFGSIAFRAHLLSALFATLTCVVLYAAIRERLRVDYQTSNGCAIFCAMLAVVAFRLTPIVWWQANAAEVYPLMLLLMALTLWLTFKAAEAPTVYMPGYALAAGLQLVHHRLAVFLIGWSALFLFWRLRRHLRDIPAARSLLGLVLPLLLLLYFPLRAWFNPPINWFDPDDWHGFIQLLAGGQFQSILTQGTVLFWRQASVGFVLTQLLLPLFAYSVLLIAALAGFGVLLFRQRFWGGMMGLAYINYQCFFMLYPVGDRENFLAPAILLACFPLAFAMMEMLTQMRRNQIKPLVLALTAVALTAASLTPFGISSENLMARLPRPMAQSDTPPAWFPQWKSAFNERFAAVGDTSAADYGHEVWRSLPNGAPILTGLNELTADNELHPLLYQHIVENRHPDSVVIGAGFLFYDWYREQLNRQTHLGLSMRQNRPAASRKAWLEDTWQTVAAPLIKRRPVYTTSYPLPPAWSPRAQIVIARQFPVDKQFVAASYAYHLPTGYLLKISADNYENQSNDE